MTEQSKRSLKAWIRILGVTRAAENHLREFLRVNHDTTLPRFDVLAALFRRRDDAMTMTELSRLLLVSNGNATAVVDRLQRDGLVQRTAAPHDRRTIHVSLTDAGRARFEALAEDHEREVAQLFSTLHSDELDALVDLLKKLRRDAR